MRRGSAPLGTRPAAPVRRSIWAWLRLVIGAGILVVLGWRLGAGPFLDGLRVIDGWAVTAACAIGAVTTVVCAWRWRLIAGTLGARMTMRTAVASYYRSLFLNTTLPGGVLGDVHRAVRHGRDCGDLGRGIRAAVWDRVAGQVVQLVLTVAVLLAVPSPVRSHLPTAAAVAVAACLAAVLIVVLLSRRTGGGRWVAALREAAADLRRGMFAPRTAVGIMLASTVVVAGQLATFLLAARTAGSAAPLAQLAPLGLLVLLAMALPVNIGGWGPREGAAAWAFGAAGLTATLGVSTAVVYGVLVIAACLPGAAVLLFGWVGAAPVRVLREGTVHG